MGTIVSLRLYRRTQPYPARLHQQLRRAPLLAILGEVVLVGYRLHLRAGAAYHSDWRPGIAAHLLVLAS